MTVTWQSHVSVCCCCTCFEFLVTCLGQAEVSGELKRTVKIKISSFFHYCIITLPCLAPSDTVGPPLSSDAASWRTSVATNHTSQTQITYSYSILHRTKRWAISTWSRQIPLPFPELRCTHIIVSRIASWRVCWFAFFDSLTLLHQRWTCVSVPPRVGHSLGKTGKKNGFPSPSFSCLTHTHAHLPSRMTSRECFPPPSVVAS